MQSSGGCDGERSYQVLSCEVRASDEVASICQGEERPNKGQTCLAEKRGTRERVQALLVPARAVQ